MSFCTNRFVELQPRSKAFYGFKEDEEQGQRMMDKHAEGIVHLFDSILQMLGPDIEFVEDILSQVGGRHAKMGVPVALFPFLGNALVWAVEKDIGTEMTDEHVEAWEEVYDAISGEIVKAILNASTSQES